MTLTKAQLGLFQAVGRDMYLTGLVSSHTGTLSELGAKTIRITKRDAMLGRLADADVLEVPLEGENPDEAPEDALIHRAIYRNPLAKAIIQARPSATMALALLEDRLSPANTDGADGFGTVAVAISQRPFGSTEVADLMGQMLKDARVAVLRGRGVFAWGDNLDEALHMVSLLDEMCRVALIYRSLSREEEQPFIPERIERSQGSLSPYRQGRDPNQRQPARNNQRRPGGPGPAGGGGGPRRDGPRRPPRGNQGGGPPGGFRP
jgi:L-fuculose-phosphate aldolase